jgi:predicted ATPase
VSEAVLHHGGRDSILCRFQTAPRVQIEVETTFSIVELGQTWSVAYELAIELPKTQAARIVYERLSAGEVGDDSWGEYINDGGHVTCSNENFRPSEWKSKDRSFLNALHTDYTVPEFSDRIASVMSYNFHPETIRRPQKTTLGGLLARDGSNLASVIESTRANGKETIERVGRYLSAITESVELAGVAKYGEYETVQFRVVRSPQGQPLVFDAASMSDGTLRTLAALVAAFQIVPPRRHPTLVAIEEPETSLHPVAMRALVDALDEATQHTQILLTTHSADLLADPDLDPSQVLVVRSRDGRTHITPVDAAGREIVRKELSTLADLQRMDQLDLDEADLRRQAAAQAGDGEA